MKNFITLLVSDNGTFGIHSVVKAININQILDIESMLPNDDGDDVSKIRLVNGEMYYVQAEFKELLNEINKK